MNEASGQPQIKLIDDRNAGMLPGLCGRPVFGCSLPGPRPVAYAAARWTWDIPPAKFGRHHGATLPCGDAPMPDMKEAAN
jgi:hypothetical protein